MYLLRLQEVPDIANELFGPTVQTNVERSDNEASGTERVPQSSSIMTGLWSRG